VYIAKAYGERGDFPYLILGKPFIGEPKTCCTETYIYIGAFDSELQAKNLVSYIKTKFFRFLVLLKKNTQNASSKVYTYVPIQNFDEPWTDEKLYAKYGLTQEEIDFIESMIRPME
jgi:site-specific DNA-methyltransferase (adenine-specific)